MKKIFISWAASLRHLFSSSFWHLFGQALWSALPVMGMVPLLFAALSVLRVCSVAFFSTAVVHLLQVKAPFLAMGLSPFYMPFLIRSTAAVMGKASCLWGKMVLWSLSMYGLMAGCAMLFYWVCVEGSVALLIAVCSVALVSIVVFMSRIVSFPVASIAVIFEPMSRRSSREVWRHAQRMTWQELPGILVLMVSLTPLSSAFYYLSRLLYREGLLSLEGAYAVLHVLSILCWQVGWLAFMVFYQQRKKAYLGG